MSIQDRNNHQPIPPMEAKREECTEVSPRPGPAGSTMQRQENFLPDELWARIVQIADSSEVDLKNFRLACRRFDSIAERFVLSRAMIYCDTAARIQGSILSTRWDTERLALYANALTLHVRTDSQMANDRLQKDSQWHSPVSLFAVVEDLEKHESCGSFLARIETLTMTDSHILAAFPSQIRTRLLSRMRDIQHLKLVADLCRSDASWMHDETDLWPLLNKLSIVVLPVRSQYCNDCDLWCYNTPWHRNTRELTFWDIKLDVSPSCNCELWLWHTLLREPVTTPNLEVLKLHTNVRNLKQLGPMWMQLTDQEDGKILVPDRRGKSLSNVAAWEKNLVSAATLKDWHMIRKKTVGYGNWEVVGDVDMA